MYKRSAIAPEKRIHKGGVFTFTDEHEWNCLLRTSRMVRGALGLENATREDIRLIAVTFGVVVTVIQTYYAPRFNPFTPAHQASMLALVLPT